MPRNCKSLARFLIETIISLIILLSFLLVTDSHLAAQDLSLKTSLTPSYKTSGISEQDLLNIDYFNKQAKNRYAKTHSLPRTLRIVILRVSFQPDTLATTTGDGTFNLTPNDSTIIDPPPHNREYFLAQLTAASHYYRSVSNENLILTGDVVPLAETAAYALPRTMDYYNPNTTVEELDLRLAELFRDAIMAADNKDQLNFSDNDIVMIFHAGVGQDFANDFDLTPQDIPSTFLNAAHLRKHLGNDDPSYPGIATSSGFVKEGIILPETQNQEGSEFAVKGTFVLLLGRQLGLPSLFDTETGRSGIGAWGLADAGASNYFGLMPAQPCAWSKVFLGWEEPILLHPGTQISVAANLAKSTPTTYKIPINAREYFLIENRSRDYDRNGIAEGLDQFDHPLQFERSGQFTAQIDTSAGERLGVITAIDEYDFAIPGSGILIWHIDDRVIEENYPSNRVNADPNRRGVDLEEADGSQDIGTVFPFLSPGSGSEFGVPHDAYYADNEIHTLANRTDFVSFSPSSTPSTSSNSGAETFTVLQNFSAIDSVMTFDYLNSASYPDFPQRFSGEIPVRFPPIVGKLQESQTSAIFFTPGNNQLFAWDSEGNSLLQRDDSLTIRNWDGSLDRFQLALFDTTDGVFSHMPVFSDQLGSNSPDLFAAVDHERVIAWSATETDAVTGFAKRMWEVARPVDHLLIWDQSLVVAGDRRLGLLSLDGAELWGIELDQIIYSICVSQTAAGSSVLAVLTAGGIHVIDQQGSIVLSRNISIDASEGELRIISGYLDNRSEPALVYNTENSIHAVSLELEDLSGFPVELPHPIVQLPTLADIDHDGFGEIILATSREIWVLNHNGTRSNGFPIAFEHSFSDIRIDLGSPLVLLDNAEGYIFAKDGINDIVAIDSEGRPVAGLNFSGGGAVAVPQISIADFDNDGALEVVDANSDGFMNVRHIPLPIRAVDGSWLQAGFDPEGTGFNRIMSSFDPPEVTELVPYAYNYPNPTEGTETVFRFFLQSDARISISIFDFAGESIAELTSSGRGQEENEIVWPLDSVSDGIYMARLQADDGSQQAVKFIKVAVVK
jgi:M6 family metalloprotease-like protein